MLFFCQPKKKLQRNEDTELQTQDTKLQATFLGPDLEKSYKETKIQSYRPNFFQRKKKLQRNKDTKLQATFLGPDLEKSYKETKIQSYRPQLNFQRKKKKKLQRNEDTKVLGQFGTTDNLAPPMLADNLTP